MSTGLTNDELCDLYQRYGHLLARRIRALLHDDQLAEDALQSVFLKLMNHGAAVRIAESPLAWLYRVAERHCYDVLRQRARDVQGGEVARLEEPRAISTIEERSALKVIWSRLNHDERAIALLLFNDGLSQEEASRRLGLTRQAVGKHVSAIRLVAERLARTPDLS